MKASSIMIFEYMGMLGVPVLLMALALFALIPIGGLLRTILLLVIGAGCLVYGAIAVRDIYVHGGKKSETVTR